MPLKNLSARNFVREIRQQLHTWIEPDYRDGAKRFFKEPIHVLGVRVPRLRQLIRTYRSTIRSWKKEETIIVCETLLRSGWHEEALLAFGLIARRQKQLEKDDFKMFEQWLHHFVTNWSLCDDFCTHVIGPFLERFPELIGRVKKWTRSKNRWLRRAAAVSLIYPLRRGLFLKEAFETADTLLPDQEDLIQKGYGWMLKEASKKFPKEIFAYVLKHKTSMPRTALRYAVEKYPDKMRKQALKN